MCGCDIILTCFLQTLVAAGGAAANQSSVYKRDKRVTSIEQWPLLLLCCHSTC